MEKASQSPLSSESFIASSSQMPGKVPPAFQLSYGDGMPSGPPMQLQVDTNYGAWHDDTYEIGQNGNQRFADIELRFEPKDPVNSRKIGLVQTHRGRKGGNPHVPNGDQTLWDHAIPQADAVTLDPVSGDTDEGEFIDRVSSHGNPLYVTNQPNAGDALGDTSENAGWGQHGHHYRNPDQSQEHKDAILKDRPLFAGAERDSYQIFETTALSVEGPQRDMYYSSVEWGWRTDAAGTFEKLPLTVASEGVPTSSFMQAAEIWNNGQTSGGADTLDLPTVDVQLTTAPITQEPAPDFVGPPLQLPIGTRVQVLRQATPDANGEIRVVDGPLEGNSIEVGAAQMLNLADER